MFLTYDEYTELGGTLAETDFNRLSYRAEQALKTHTLGRVQIADERVKKCMFDLIALESQNTGVKSVSNDGYSITYQSAKEVTEAEYNIIYNYFADTDALYKGTDGIGYYEPEVADAFDYIMVLDGNGNYAFLMVIGENGWDYLQVLKK